MNVFKTDGKYHQLKIDNNQSKSKKKNSSAITRMRKKESINVYNVVLNRCFSFVNFR